VKYKNDIITSDCSEQKLSLEEAVRTGREVPNLSQRAYYRCDAKKKKKKQEL